MGIIKKYDKNRNQQDGPLHESDGTLFNASRKGVIKSHLVKMSGSVTVPSASAFFSSEKAGGMSSQPIDVPYQQDEQALELESPSGGSQEDTVPVIQSTPPVQHATQKPESEWQKEIDEAYQRGISETESRLKQNYEDRIKAISTDLLTSINSLVTEKKAVFESAQTQVLSFAIQVTERIISEEIKASPDLLRRIIDEALSKITETDKVIIRASKDDLPYINSILPELQVQLKSVQLLTAQEDRSVSQGGIVIETDLGFIDASVEMKLDIIKEAYQEFVKKKEVT